jgi:hypothetical protein
LILDLQNFSSYAQSVVVLVLKEAAGLVNFPICWLVVNKATKWPPEEMTEQTAEVVSKEEKLWGLHVLQIEVPNLRRTVFGPYSNCRLV